MGETPPQDHAAANPALQSTTSVVISRKRFNAVPRKRAWYIGLYTLSFLLWAYMAIGILRLDAAALEETTQDSETTQNVEQSAAEPPVLDPSEWPKSIQVARLLIPVVLALFYVPFVSVLRTMGYPWIGVFAVCGFAFAPIPGLLVVAYLDTRIAKTWNAADPDSITKSA